MAADPGGEPALGTGLVTSVVQVTHDGVSKSRLVSDSSFLYVTEWPQAHQVVARVSLGNASRSVLPSTLPNPQALDISRDHTQLLVSTLRTGSSDGEFWTLSTWNGSPQRVGDLSGSDGAWSSDGKLLVFAKASSLYVAEANGSSSRELFNTDGTLLTPRVAPDQTRIRFTVENTARNTTAIWEINLDGSNPHPLFPAWAHASSACCGVWTRDGRYYIFQVTDTSSTALSTLWALLDAGGATSAAPIQLTNGPASFGNATPSQDGKSIWAIGVQPAAEPVKYNLRQSRFVSLLTGVSATDLDYSKDGKWVTYVSIPDGTLWRSKADGTGWLKLTSSPERAALPHWSPDGRQIAYVSMQPGQAWKIAIIPASGGPAEVLLPEDRSQIDANWSPDGDRIMFGYIFNARGNIRIFDLKTHKAEDIPGSEGLFSPRWSPNGRYIAALSADFTRVMVFDFESKKWTNWLIEPAGAVSYPVWAADSKYLYFDDLVTGEESIRRIKVGTKRTERVFKLEGIERYPGPFGLWSGRAGDGSFMFIRDRSTQEVYQLGLQLP